VIHDEIVGARDVLVRFRSGAGVHADDQGWPEAGERALLFRYYWDGGRQGR
jgi:hypothetical protein